MYTHTHIRIVHGERKGLNLPAHSRCSRNLGRCVKHEGCSVSKLWLVRLLHAVKVDRMAAATFDRKGESFLAKFVVRDIAINCDSALRDVEEKPRRATQNGWRGMLTAGVTSRSWRRASSHRSTNSWSFGSVRLGCFRPYSPDLAPPPSHVIFACSPTWGTGLGRSVSRTGGRISFDGNRKTSV